MDHIFAVAAALGDGLRWWCRTACTATERGALLYAGGDRYLRGGINVFPWFSI